MLLDWVGLLVVAVGPCVLVLAGIVALFKPFGPKSASRDRLIEAMSACREALDLDGDPASHLTARPDDQPVTLALEDPEKTNLPDLVLSAARGPAGLKRQLPVTIDRIRPIALRRETSDDKMGKLLLINRELQTGDEAFDDGVYVETTAPFEIASDVLYNPRVRKSVHRLLDDGWTRVVLYGKVLVRLEQVPTTEASIEKERIERAIDEVAALARTLPPIVAEHPEEAKPELRRKVLSGLFVAAWLAGAALTIAGVRLWPPLTLTPYLVCSAAAVVLFVVSLPVLALLIRGRSDSLHAMYKLLVWQFVGWLPFCVGIGTVANGLFDPGSRTEHTAGVIALHSTTQSTRFATRYAELESWIDDHDTLLVPIKEPTYQELSSKEAEEVTVQVGSGALGWPWSAGVRSAGNVP